MGSHNYELLSHHPLFNTYVREIYFIHSADPQSLSVVITIFTLVVVRQSFCTAVCPSKNFKIKQISLPDGTVGWLSGSLMTPVLFLLCLPINDGLVIVLFSRYSMGIFVGKKIQQSKLNNELKFKTQLRLFLTYIVGLYFFLYYEIFFLHVHVWYCSYSLYFYTST